jgi:hypothetical protein
MIINPSERLSYRLMTLADGPRLLDVDSDPLVMKYITKGVPSSVQDIDLGWVLVRPMHFFSENPEFNNWELGWRFKQATWGRGQSIGSDRLILE